MTPTHPLFLGVDAGGTKTAVCIVDRRGNRRAQIRAPSMYYFDEGIELVKRVLGQAVAQACAEAATSTDEITYAFVGFPGYGEASADTPMLDAIPEQVFGHKRYSCGNDMICGWAGSLGAADGINVVSGTGSMAYGERNGVGVRTGGWGEAFGDEGSGYWIGVQGLRVFSQMSDGRKPPGPLLDAFRERLELERDLDAVSVVINRWQRRRAKIASLSHVVVAAAQSGDTEAVSILTRAGIELSRLVVAVAAQLGFPEQEGIPVSFSGGIFEVDAVLQSFRQAMTRAGSAYRLRAPLLDPAAGAALYAARCAGTPLDPAAVRRLAAG